MELLTLRPEIRKELADAVREKSGVSGGMTFGEMVTAVRNIPSFKVQTGVIVPEADSSAIVIPRVGRLIHVYSPDVPIKVGNVTSVVWEKGPNENNSWQLAVYGRYKTIDPLTLTESSASAFHSLADDTIEFSTQNAERVFAAGATYVWVALDWDGNYVKDCYNVAKDESSSARLVLLDNGDGTYQAHLIGAGDTRDFASGAVKPWHEYIDQITSIFVGKDITALGSRLFQRHEAVKQLVFEDSSKIQHIGGDAFTGCQFGGEFSFPNLQDTEINDAFSNCIKLRNVSLNGKVTKIGTGAFSGCLNLHSLDNVNESTQEVTIGVGAFMYTPKLESVDVREASAKESAFRLSNGMRYDDSVLEETLSDSTARWNFNGLLEDIRKVKLANVAAPKVNADGQYQYDYINFCTRMVDGKKTKINISQDGCMALTIYHLYNALNGAPYESFVDFWEEKILRDGETLESGIDIDINLAQAELARRLGWKQKDGFPIQIKDNAVAAKKAIADALQKGDAVAANIRLHTVYQGEVTVAGHGVAIIGSNAVTDKLIVADSIRLSGKKGHVFEISFEQFFGVLDGNVVIVYETGGDK